MNPVQLTAYPIVNTDDWSLIPAPATRDWMDATQEKFAYRCLPLVMANQSGWIITSPVNFTAIWNGKTDFDGVRIRLHFPDGVQKNVGAVSPHFGSGTFTFNIPWLFRTSPGYGLWVRGVPNFIKDGAQPLEGLVETDWAPYTFTVNWKLTRPDHEVTFTKGDPIAMIVPFPLDLPEAVAPDIRALDTDPVLKQDFMTFAKQRADKIKNRETAGRGAQWTMDYMRGHRPDGAEITEHRKAFRLRPFSKP